MGLNKRIVSVGALSEVPMSDQFVSSSLQPTGTNCNQQRVSVTAYVNLDIQGTTSTIRVELYRSSSSNMSSPTLQAAWDRTTSGNAGYSPIYFYNFCNACGWYPGQPYCPNVYFRFTVFDKDNPTNTANGSIITI
jgi:hypothetical protein